MNKVLPGNTLLFVFPGKSYYIMSRRKPMAYTRMKGSSFGAPSARMGYSFARRPKMCRERTLSERRETRLFPLVAMVFPEVWSLSCF